MRTDKKLSEVFCCYPTIAQITLPASSEKINCAVRLVDVTEKKKLTTKAKKLIIYVCVERPSVEGFQPNLTRLETLPT